VFSIGNIKRTEITKINEFAIFHHE